jgi:hypothetical protein
VTKNLHRWRESLSAETNRVLEEAAERLEWAWSVDQKHPNSFPVNTDYAFAEIQEKLRYKSSSNAVRKLLSLPPPPKCLSDLLDEKTIKGVYEDQNDGSYEDALKRAAAGLPKGTSAWRKISQALSVAYMIDYYGLEHAPKPRVQFLHRNLLSIADSLDVGDMRHSGIVEFLDDICPCGKKHTSEAIRKLRKRWSRAQSKR